MAFPIFILGLTQRSGTNLLYRALLEHPDCAAARQPGEDYLLHEADLLDRYVRRVAAHWNPEWNRGDARMDDLAQSLGRGLVSHLSPETTKSAFVSKTPSARNVGLISHLVPDARVLVVVRDGRDVVESGVQGLGWSYPGGFRRWAEAAAELLRFRTGSDGDSVTLIRFERLVEAPTEELRTALAACGLDPERYPFESLADLPVYGSSQLRGERAEVHWEPVAKSEGFAPVGRWRSWDDALKLEYDRVCGSAAERLGYTREGAAHGVFRKLGARLRALMDRR